MASGSVRLGLGSQHGPMEQTQRKSTDELIVTRELLLERVTLRANRDDAFLTLPYTLMYMAVFIALVVTHLRIFDRKKVEIGINDWLVGYSKEWGGPYVMEHVVNIPTFWAWLDDSGLPSVLGTEVNRSGQRSCIIAHRNYVISDVKFTQKRIGGEEERATWFMHSLEAQNVLESGPDGTLVGAALARSKHLQSIDWADEATEELKLSWLTFNEEVKTFTKAEIRVIFEPYGVVTRQVMTSAVFLQPYEHVGAVISSILFLCCMLYPLVNEGRDMITSLRLGCHSFKEYWQFWNIVDWTAIIAGIGGSIIWILCTISMTANPIDSILNEDFVLENDYMSLETEQVDDLLDAIDVVISYFLVLHQIFAFDVVAIVLKMFKAFRSNARLSIVTDTLAAAFVDITHFMIVFGVIFFSFALVGHILFGKDLRQFITFGDSAMTSFHVLMGEFGWYAEFTANPIGFGSGIPGAYLAIWFLSFMTFALLILLNMLLSIILDQYSKQSVLLHESAEDTQLAARSPLWTQARRYLKRKKQTKGFIPIADVGLKLDDSSVHPAEIVTAESLQDAFPEMKPEQVSYLMKWITKSAASHGPSEGRDDVEAKLERVESLVSSMAAEIQILKEQNVQQQQKFDSLKEQNVMQQQNFEKQQATILRGVDLLTATLPNPPLPDPTRALVNM